MIFQSVNEDGIPAWQLILNNKKTVTRRAKPKRLNSIVSVQPRRCAKGVCKIKIKNCMLHTDWLKSIKSEEEYQREAEREGFKTYDGLMCWLKKHAKTEIENLWRIEFELVK